MSSSCSSFAGFVLDDLDIRAVARASPRFVGLDPSSELILSDECARSIVDSLCCGGGCCCAGCCCGG